MRTLYEPVEVGLRVGDSTVPVAAEVGEGGTGVSVGGSGVSVGGSGVGEGSGESCLTTVPAISPVVPITMATAAPISRTANRATMG
jgi:hypothetical protein